jgi:hypothetical protein
MEARRSRLNDGIADTIVAVAADPPGQEVVQNSSANAHVKISAVRWLLRT